MIYPAGCLPGWLIDPTSCLLGWLVDPTGCLMDRLVHPTVCLLGWLVNPTVCLLDRLVGPTGCLLDWLLINPAVCLLVDKIVGRLLVGPASVDGGLLGLWWKPTGSIGRILLYFNIICLKISPRFSGNFFSKSTATHPSPFGFGPPCIK